jgi:hypothetical protein
MRAALILSNLAFFHVTFLCVSYGTVNLCFPQNLQPVGISNADKLLSFLGRT